SCVLGTEGSASPTPRVVGVTLGALSCNAGTGCIRHWSKTCISVPGSVDWARAVSVRILGYRAQTQVSGQVSFGVWTLAWRMSDGQG
ncbi:hypothetical protein KIPB_016313, partial [Kipferlia bialata]